MSSWKLEGKGRSFPDFILFFVFRLFVRFHFYDLFWPFFRPLEQLRKFDFYKLVYLATSVRLLCSAIAAKFVFQKFF